MIDIKEASLTRTVTIKSAMERMTRVRLGILLIVGQDGLFERTLTDGDLRRLLLSDVTMEETLESLPTINSVSVSVGWSRRLALSILNQHKINHLPVLDGGRVVDIIERREIDDQILLSTPHMGDSERGFVEEAFRTNWIAPIGPNVDSFESELAGQLGVGSAAALSSGTAAIHLALNVLGVRAGDIVFCSALTFVASCNPILYLGAIPVFIDSDFETWNMSPAALEKALSKYKKIGTLPTAIIVVNLYGQSADMDSIISICNAYHVPIVEDAAESLGAKYKGRYSGTFGKLGTFSFNGNKIITTSGGGMLVSNDDELIKKARFLSTQARDYAPHYQHSQVGFNYRMSNILAGVGRGQLKVLGDRILRRREIFKIYQSRLSDFPGVKWMPEPEGFYSTRWLSILLLDPRAMKITANALIEMLAEELIEARPVWKPMQLQPLYEKCDYVLDKRSISEELFENGVCLPSGSSMTDDQVDRVCSVIKKNLRKH